MARFDRIKLAEAALRLLQDQGATLPAGKRLRALREARKWTQEQLGDALGVSKVAVSSWESESVLPSGANPELIHRWTREVAGELDVPVGLQKVLPISPPEWLPASELARLRPAALAPVAS